MNLIFLQKHLFRGQAYGEIGIQTNFPTHLFLITAAAVGCGVYYTVRYLNGTFFTAVPSAYFLIIIFFFRLLAVALWRFISRCILDDLPDDPSD